MWTPELPTLKVYREWLCVRTCQRLLDLRQRWLHRARGKDYTGNPVLWVGEVADPDDRQLLLQVAGRVHVQVQRWFQKTMIEGVFVAGLPVGGYHEPHADNARRASGGGWEPNHTPQRSYSALVYLNSGFGGGELQFMHHRTGRLLTSIRPTAGMLVAFPSDCQHFHQVTPVTEGIRCSMPVWFTQDASKQLAM